MQNPPNGKAKIEKVRVPARGGFSGDSLETKRYIIQERIAKLQWKHPFSHLQVT